MLAAMLDQTGAGLVSLSGGEPLLREDLLEIVDFLARRHVTINLICNGTLLDEQAIARLADGVEVAPAAAGGARRGLALQAAQRLDEARALAGREEQPIPCAHELTLVAASDRQPDSQRAA